MDEVLTEEVASQQQILAVTASGRRPTAGHDCNVQTVCSNFDIYKG